MTVIAEATRERDVGLAAQGEAGFLAKRNAIDQTLMEHPADDPKQAFSMKVDLYQKAMDATLADLPEGNLRAHVAAQLNVHLEEAKHQALVQYGADMAKAGPESVYQAVHQFGVLAATATDPKEQTYNYAQGRGLIEGNPYMSPEARQEGMLEFDHQVQHDRLANLVVVNPPAAAMELHRPDFAEKYPLVTGEERGALAAHASDQWGYQWREAADMHRDDQGKNEAHIEDLISQGKPYQTELESMRAHLDVRPEFYVEKTGHPFIADTPAARDGFIADIENAKTPEELDAVEKRMEAAGSLGILAPKSKPSTELRQRREDLNDATHVAGEDAWTAISEKNFGPKSPMDKLTDPFARKVQESKAKAYFMNSLKKYKGDVGKATDDFNSHYGPMLKPRTPASDFGATLGVH